MDLALYFLAVVPLTHALTSHPVAMWLALPGAMAALWTGYNHAPPSAARSVDAFKAAKIASALAAVLVVNSAQAGWAWSSLTVAVVLGVNMLEASVADAAVNPWYGVPNALCGALLVLLLASEVAGAAPLTTHQAHQQAFLFPLSHTWVALYTSWNAAFCYGVDFAWSFRLALAAALIVSHVTLATPGAWLGARTYSLVLNQVFRGARASHIFTPGKSWVTKPEGEVHVRQGARLAWGLANLAAVAVACVVGVGS